MAKALLPAEAVKVWPSTLNWIMMAVLPMPLLPMPLFDDVALDVSAVDIVVGGIVVVVVEATVSAKAVYVVDAGDAGVVVLVISKAGVGSATAVPSMSARGGSKTKFGSAASHMLQVDQAGTRLRTWVGIAKIGFMSDKIVEHCGGGVYDASVQLSCVIDTSVLQRFIQL